jgi:hypothetical protein
LTNAIDVVEKGICAPNPLPVIVAVRSPTSHKFAGHFVVITGEIVNPDGSKAFTIKDPAYSKTIIGTDWGTGSTGYVDSTGAPEFATRGVVKDPVDLTGLSVSVDATANLMVTDPNGLQSGYNSSNSTPLQNIPRSGAGVDEIDDDVTGNAGNPVQIVMINSPAPGTFQFSLTGAATGQYSLNIGAEATDGTVQTSSFLGLSSVGTTVTYRLSYGPSPGSTQNPTLLATFASTLADIPASLQLGLIDNQGIANSLSQKINAAQSATGSARNNILNAFKNEINAQSGQHITRIASQVLLQDADSLISQNQ